MTRRLAALATKLGETCGPLALIVVVLMAAAACFRPKPLPVNLEILQTDFIGHDLSVDFRAGAGDSGRRFQPWRLGRGWSRSDSKGRWAFGESVELQVVTLGGARRLRIECRPFHGLTQHQRVEVTVDGDPVGVFRPETKGFGWYRVDLPETLCAGVVTIGLRFDHTRSPHDAGLGPDRRPLALKVQRLALTRGPWKAHGGDGSSSVFRTGRGLRVAREGRLFINVWSDRAVERVTLSLKQRAEGVDGLSVTLRDPESGDELDRVRVVPSPQGAVIGLEAGGVRGFLQLVVDGGSGGLEIENLQAMALPAETQQQPGPGRKTGVPEVGPDLIVFVLDAARADHCGAAYGYHRDTTPRLDALAREALVFRRVFAQAPYTTCSVPTMFTGVAFGSHGVVRGRDRLSEEEKTLAEALREAGYRTIGVTATPNNSERLGMAQGFDLFEQLWEGADWTTSIDPMFAAERIETIVGDLQEEGPLFLMAHLVPPHSPYTPPEDFRLWSDGDYDGPCDGSNEYLAGIREHRDQVSPADIEQLVALYDGNLRFSDAAVERILKALDSAGRLKGAIVVVTADHGEAFFEHGKLDHNSTVYDEMLRVPLIVRLPPELEVESADLDRLASLEDLTPTLLRLAGVTPSPRATGVDLFSGPPRPGILLRTSEGPGVFGFRSGRWKLIADRGARLSELYDLEADPGERTNVILRFPGVMSSLAARWDRAEALLPARLDIVDVGMTDEEKAMLHELGYIDSEPEGQRPVTLGGSGE